MGTRGKSPAHDRIRDSCLLRLRSSPPPESFNVSCWRHSDDALSILAAAQWGQDTVNPTPHLPEPTERYDPKHVSRAVM